MKAYFKRKTFLIGIAIIVLIAILDLLMEFRVYHLFSAR